MKRWLGDSVIPQAHPVRLVVRRRGTEVVEAGTLEQPELPDGLVHVRRVEHADLGEPSLPTCGEAPAPQQSLT
jgi:hypothetical protein